MIKKILIAGLSVCFFVPEMAFAATGGEPVFKMVRQSPADFNDFMTRTKSSYKITVTKTGRNLMHYAAKCQDSYSNVRMLAANGVDSNSKDKNGTTPLMLAAESYCSTSVYHLLQVGANVNDVDLNGLSPLHYWSKKSGGKRQFKELIGAGAELDLKDFHGRSPLMIATYTLNYKGVERLLDAGADYNVTDNYGVTIVSLLKSNEFVSMDRVKSKSGQKSLGKITKIFSLKSISEDGVSYVNSNYEKNIPTMETSEKEFAESQSSTTNSDSGMRQYGSISRPSEHNSTQSNRMVVSGESSVPETLAIADRSIEVAGLRLLDSVKSATSHLVSRKYEPTSCMDPSYFRGSNRELFDSSTHVAKAFTFAQRKDMLENPQYAELPNREGVRQACFYNTSTMEYVFIDFAQLEDTARISRVQYVNHNHELTVSNFYQSVIEKYGKPVCNDDYWGSATKQSNSSKCFNNYYVLKLYNRKGLYLRDKRIDIHAEDIVRDYKAQIQKKRELNKNIKTTF